MSAPRSAHLLAVRRVVRTLALPLPPALKSASLDLLDAWKSPRLRGFSCTRPRGFEPLTFGSVGRGFCQAGSPVEPGLRPGCDHAAVASDAQAIVTLNLRHFPTEACKPFAIEALHPNSFLLDLDGLDSDHVFMLSSAKQPSSAAHPRLPTSSSTTSRPPSPTSPRHSAPTAEVHAAWSAALPQGHRRYPWKLSCLILRSALI